MRKFLFTIQFIAIIAFVPAVTYAYLHNDAPKDNNTVKVENTNDMGGQHQTTGVIRLIKGL
jgi:citrate lyase synthetase